MPHAPTPPQDLTGPPLADSHELAHGGGHSKFSQFLERSPVLSFAGVLLSAIASHLMAAETYNFFFQMEAFQLQILVIAAFLSLVCLAVLKNVANRWAWTALLTFVLLQLLCLGLHHGHFGLLLLTVPMYFLYQHARKNAHDEVAVRSQRTFDKDLSNAGRLELPSDELLPMIHEVTSDDEDFIKASALIQFLSPISEQGRALIAALPDTAHFGDLESFASLEDRSCSWYMPLKAIHAHVARPPLSAPFEVILLPSAPDVLSDGTHGLVEEFRSLVRHLSQGKWNVVITVLPAHQAGIRYEDAKELSIAINDSKHYLREKKTDPVVIDITSGKATCSAVGASLALQSRERFQYVSTTDRRVRLYDLRYYSRELPLAE